MCFNLFFPFLAKNNRHLQLLRGIFPTDTKIEAGGFEVIINPVEGTNFDFCLQTNRSKSLFELKLTESSFGAARPDKSHVQKFQRIYAPAMAGKFAPEFCSCDRFLQHYQIGRNVWNLATETDDKLIVVVPRANERLKGEIAAIEGCLSKQFKGRVVVRYLEEVVVSIENALPPDDRRLREHFRHFRQKYIL